MSTLQDVSKQNWSGEARTLEQINAGSLQRIANATELMAKSYSDIIEQRDRWQRWYEEELELNAKLSRSINSYRGVITKLRAHLRELKGE